MWIPDRLLEFWVMEDVGFGDLTSSALGISGMGKALVRVRERAVIAGSEEAAEIYRILGADVVYLRSTGTVAEAGDVILEARGDLKSLHAAWRISQVLLAICSGVATKSKRLLEKARKVNPDVAVVSTRKTYPGLRALMFKSVQAGGVMPHRTSLSDSILIFENHVKCIGGLDVLLEIIPRLKKLYPFRKIGVEVRRVEDALRLARAGVDMIQFDKLSPKELSEAVSKVRETNPRIELAAAGGIDEHNIEEYAKTKVNMIVTSAPYHAKPIDIGTEITKTT